jgi:hypothetical protein
LNLLALRPLGTALPAIHDSMAQAFRSLGISVFEIPVPTLPEDIVAFQRAARNNFQAVFAIDAGVSADFISIIKECQKKLRIPWIIWFLDDPEGYRFPGVFDPDLRSLFAGIARFPEI